MVTPTGVSLSRIEAARHSRLDAGACYYLSAAASSSVQEDETPVPGATGEFYPYVFVQMDTEAPGA